MLPQTETVLVLESDRSYCESKSREGIAVRKRLGRYIVMDSNICHGQPTFRGTRILVKDVIDQVAEGIPWETIEKQWRGAVSSAAIAEAVRLAGEAFVDHVAPTTAAPAHG